MRALVLLFVACICALGLAAAATGDSSDEPTFADDDLGPIVATKPPQPVQLRFTVGDP